MAAILISFDVHDSIRCTPGSGDSMMYRSVLGHCYKYSQTCFFIMVIDMATPLYDMYECTLT